MRFIAAFASLAGLSSATLLGLANVDANVSVGSIAQVDAHVGVYSTDFLAAKKVHAGYKCPHDLSYCPWTKSCSCPPGQKLDLATKTCVGDKIKGAWPKPDVSVYASVGVKLDTFCAASPTKITKYDENHQYCQASLVTIVFCADADINVELVDGVEIDVNANISADLKNVCGALSGLYIESAIDAAVAFSSNTLGYAVVKADIELSLGAVLNIINKLTCKLGLGDCHFDCVAYCTKGCPNYIDVGELGGRITGLVGFCILPKVILVVNSLKVVVNVVIDNLLCLVGGIIKTVLSTFDCHCK